MVQVKPFSYNSNAKYQPSGVYNTKDLDIINQTIEVKQASDSPSGFKVKFPQILAKYVLPYVESDAIVQNWHERQMQFWQNQINFALWCATSGCGVSMQDHLTGTIPLFARSLFLLYVYYQTRRILFEMKVALPTDDSWNAFDNSYDKKANQGLGTMYNYWTMDGYHPLLGAEYDKKRYSFTQTTTNTLLHIDYIAESFP